MRVTRRALVVAALLASPSAATATSAERNRPQHTSHAIDPAVALVDRVREATRPFQDVQQALLAGYKPFLGCVSGAQDGAMGVHYVNSALVADGELDVNHPEALLYETRNGAFRLVGAEYIVMFDAWHARHAEPPVLEGQVFHYEASPNRFGLPAFYELHVWAWRANPRGAFVDWNARVSCKSQ
ncbi:MAG TPA: hypothetical protein VGH34_21295 [Vicinamibacterales bacterium]|jgi:hypothetical protein